MSNYRLKAAAVTAILIGGGLLLYESPSSEKVEKIETVAKVESPKKVVQETPSHGFGYVNFEQILQKHSKGEELRELIGKEIRLRLELNELMRPVFPPKLPEFDTTPFEESARKRNMQNIISQFAELNARKKRLAEEYKQQTEASYIERRNANREIFMNESFNITLKIQNAEVLHLTPEQIQQYRQRLDEITFERNEKQRELLEEWTKEINDYVEAQVADEAERIKKEAKELEEKYSEEAMQKLRETQERNKKLMEAAIQEIAFRNTRRQEILDELNQTTRERAKVEDEIIDSITNEAGKLGALYKLQMVLVRRESLYTEEKLSKNAEMIFNLTTPKSPGALIFEGTDTKDLTKDLLKTIH